MNTIKLVTRRITSMLTAIVVIIISTGAISLPQVNEHNISRFTTANGLNNNNITVIFTDSKGLLWIGTNDGLSRYDGYRFKTYRYCDTEDNCIAGNMIRAIDETSDANIWIATAEHGLCMWQRTTDDFICLINNPKIKDLPESDILGMRVIDNKIYVKTPNFLSVIDPATYNVFSTPIVENLIRKFNHGQVTITPIHNSKQILISGIDGNHIFDVEKQSFVKSGYSPKDKGSTYSAINCGKHLAVTTNNGISVFDSLLILQRGYPTVDYDFNNTAIAAAGDTALWIVGENRLAYLSLNDGELHTIISDINSSRETGTIGISTVLEDKNHNLWVGTKHNGLMRIDLKSPKFNSYTFDNETDIPAMLSGLNIDIDGTMIFAAGNKGVGIISKPTGYKASTLKFIKIQDREAITTLIRKDKTIWIGTNEGIFIVNQDNNKVTEFDYSGMKEFKNLIGQNKITGLLEDRLNNIWIATSFGLFKYNGSTITSYFCESYTKTGLCNDWVNVVYEDRQGWIWVGTNEGVKYLIPGESEFLHNPNLTGQPKNISNNHVLSFCQISDQEIMIGTRSGLTVFSKTNNSFSIFPYNSLLTNDVINNIVIDGQKQIWIGTNNGVAMINQANQITNFHKRDGLRNSYFFRGTMAMYEGKVFFAGSNGIDFIDPADIRTNHIMPDLKISDITLVQHNGSKKSLQIKDGSLSLKYRNNTAIVIDFSSLDYTYPERCLYKVFVEGTDQKWSIPSNNSQLTLHSLQPGSYVVNILGTNGDQIWSDQPVQLKIDIRPPLWKTKYAYIFYFVIALVILHLFGNYRLLKIKKDYQNLEQKSQAKGILEEQRDRLAKVHQSLKDSISYAKRIQEALIPSEDMVRMLFPEAFVYFRPKDIVSGDFYWSFENDEKQIIVVADCTGHGVPGAFMSIIGLDLIKNAVEQQMEYDPATILWILNKGIHATFAINSTTDSDGFHINDGMDISICVIDKATNTMTYAGGMSSIYLVRDNEMFTYKGDRRPIGSVASGETYQFEKQTIELQNKDYIYLFTDGYSDQFGGPEGKKFKYRRFRHLLLNIHKLPSQDQKNIIHQKLEEWIGTKYEQVDDILIMGFAYIQQDNN